MEDGSLKEQFRSIHSILIDRRECLGAKPYVIGVDQGVRLSFNDIHDYTAKVANFLKDRNASKRTRACLIGKNCVETLILFLGIMRYGAIACPVNFEESPENISRIIQGVKPELCFYDRDLSPPWGAAGFPSFSYSDAPAKGPSDLFTVLDRFSPSFDEPVGGPEDIAEILFTSGTTETPKGVVISRLGLFLMVDEVIRKIGLTSDGRVLEYRAYSWASTQLLTILSTLRVGATLVLARKFSRSRFPEWLTKYEVTLSSGVPTVINMLVSQPVELRKRDVPALKFMTSSSAPLSVEMQRQFESMYGIRINQMAGMTEAGWMIGNPPDKPKTGSVGTPFFYKRVSILDEYGRECPEGCEGEVVVQGPSLALGYLNDEGEVDPFPTEGFRTGDLGYKDSDGYVFITGRKKDLIIRGGVNISPNEITDRILHCPGVRDAATIGIPDKIYGEEVACFVVPAEGADIGPEDVLQHCSKTLPDFKLPKVIRFLDEIPKTERGKVAKVLLLRILTKGEVKKPACSVSDHQERRGEMLILRSTAFENMGPIPSRYAERNSISPPLQWENVPKGTKSLALTVTDPDLPPEFQFPRVFAHWMLFDIPATANGLDEGVSPGGNLPAGCRELNSDFVTFKIPGYGKGYGGPWPPDSAHRYVFTLYALKTESLNIPDSGDIVDFAKGVLPVTISTAVLIGTYGPAREKLPGT